MLLRSSPLLLNQRCTQTSRALCRSHRLSPHSSLALPGGTLRESPDYYLGRSPARLECVFGGRSANNLTNLQAQRLNTPSITDGILDLALTVFGCLRVWENPHRTNSQQGKVVVGTSGRHTIDLLTYALAELSHNHLSLAPSPSPLSSSH